jgi:hypothetical protein
MQACHYEDAVFINCPFDKEYEPLLRAIIFVVCYCGFTPVSALGEDNAMHNRLDKIVKCIRNCQYSIHDLSRLEMSANGLPRMNMPFELGLFYGARHFGNKVQQQKNALIFERDKYTYLEFITDLRGVDVKAHHNDAETIICKIRHWLKTATDKASIPDTRRLVKAYYKFVSSMKLFKADAVYDKDDILFNDCCNMVKEMLLETQLSNRTSQYLYPEHNGNEDTPGMVNDPGTPYIVHYKAGVA